MQKGEHETCESLLWKTKRRWLVPFGRDWSARNTKLSLRQPEKKDSSSLTPRSSILCFWISCCPAATGFRCCPHSESVDCGLRLSSSLPAMQSRIGSKDSTRVPTITL